MIQYQTLKEGVSGVEFILMRGLHVYAHWKVLGMFTNLALLLDTLPLLESNNLGDSPGF